MARHARSAKQYLARVRADKAQAKLLKELIRFIPTDWQGRIELAKDAGICPQTLWSWAEGVTLSPRINTMVKVATALGYELTMAKSKPNLRLVKR
jgi:DNA-binding phage protein